MIVSDSFQFTMAALEDNLRLCITMMGLRLYFHLQWLALKGGHGQTALLRLSGE